MSVSTEVDVRLFTVTGLRKRFPAQWLESVEFSLSERGGCIDGVIVSNARWEEMQLAGTEYVEIRLWGQLLYRGWVRQPQNEVTVPERCTLNLYGGMELLNGYIVQKNYCYLAQEISGIFLQMYADFVTRAYPIARLSTWSFDTTGVPALDITVAQFQCQGKTFSEAMNALCDLAPGQLIWGCDIDGSGNNRVYLRPRSSTVAYHYSVGETVTALVYPVDATQVVNSLYITGGPIQPPNLPNLLQNPSFEVVSLPGETTSNLLRDGGFEDAVQSGATAPIAWYLINNPTLTNVQSRSGSNSLKLDNSPSQPEGCTETIYGVFGSVPLIAVGYASAGSGETWDIFITLTAFNSAGSSIGSVTSSTFVIDAATIGNNVWTPITLSYTTPAGTVAVSVTYELTSATSTNGLFLDDCSLYSAVPMAAGWALSNPLGIPPAYASTGGYCSSIIWGFGNELLDGTQAAPYDGDLMVQANITITGGAGSYVELATGIADNEVSASPYHAYSVGFYVQCPAGTGSVEVGARIWSAGVYKFTAISPSPVAIASGASWQWVTLTFDTLANCDNLDVFLRFCSSGLYYVDAAQLVAGPLGSPNQTLYTQDSTFLGYRNSNDYDTLQIGVAQAASIASWGEREAAVSNDDVIDEFTCDAFATGYLAAYAAPPVQARLTIEGATSPLLLTGTVEILNLPDPPTPEFPSKVTYSITDVIKIDADIGSERPDFATLLRAIVSTGTGAF